MPSIAELLEANRKASATEQVSEQVTEQVSGSAATEETEPKQKVEDRILALLLEQLKAGVNPWQRPWVAANGAHRNLVSGHIFSGQNPGWLHFWTQVCGFSNPLWLTFAQGRSKGWFPIKGTKACSIVVPKPIQYDKKDKDGNVLTDDNGDPIKAGMTLYRHQAIFHSSQMQGEGLAEAIVAALDDDRSREDREPLADAEALLQPWLPKIALDQYDKAYYVPARDMIHMPFMERFREVDGYYATAFHELSHMTGHSTRLDRPGISGSAPRGGEEYAFEELVAELSACLLCHGVGIQSTLENHASYLHAWQQKLEDEGFKALTRAMGQASRAAEWIRTTGPDGTPLKTPPADSSSADSSPAGFSEASAGN